MQIIFEAKPSDAKLLKGVTVDRLRCALRHIVAKVVKTLTLAKRPKRLTMKTPASSANNG